MFANTQDLFDHVFDGNILDAAAVDYITANFAEDELLDYKSGQLTGSHKGQPTIKRGRERFVEAVLAMANARGGLILLGVDRTAAIDGIQTPDPRRWVDDVLQHYRSRMAEWPRISPVTTPKGVVALVQILPNPQLVAHRDGRILLRRGQENAEAEGYLLQMLYAGTHRGPRLEVVCTADAERFQDLWPPGGGSGHLIPSITARLRVGAVNGSLSWASKFKIGIVLHRLRPLSIFSSPPPPLLSRFHVVPGPSSIGSGLGRLDLQNRLDIAHHPFDPPEEISPFDQHQFVTSALVVPNKDPWESTVGIYFLPDGMTPQFWEVELHGHGQYVEVVNSKATRRPKISFKERQP